MSRLRGTPAFGMGAFIALLATLVGAIWLYNAQEGRDPDGAATAVATGSPTAGLAGGTAQPSPLPLPRVYIPLTAQNLGGPPGPSDVASTPTPESTGTAGPSATPAPPPSPTPTRRPMRQTKLGVGLYDSGGVYLAELDRLRPSVILIIDPDPWFAQELRRMFPKAFIVGRIFLADQPLDNPVARGDALADLVAQKAVPLKGVVNAWMGYNERLGHNVYEDYVLYDKLQAAFARRLQGHYGISAVASNDSSATIEPEDYARYFADSISASDYFGIHAYSPNGVKSLRDPEGQVLVLRYRKIHEELVKAGVKHGPFIITEVGLWDGWVGVTSEASMADDFIWYAEELAKDDYVVGTTLFGMFGPGRWEQFNISGTSMLDRLGEYGTEPLR